MTKKYLSKDMIQINDNLRAYRYFYATYATVYIVPRSADEETTAIRIPYNAVPGQVGFGVSGNSYNKGVTVP